MSLGAPVRGGSVDRFISRWAEGTLGRKTKEGALSVEEHGVVSSLWSYAVPIASIYDRKYLVVSESRALVRTSMTTNAHLRMVERVVGGHYGQAPRFFSSEQTGTITQGRIPIDQYDWVPILVAFDERNSGGHPTNFRGWQ